MEVKCHRIQEFASIIKLLANLGMDMRLMVHLKLSLLPLVFSQLRCSEQHLWSSPLRMSNRLSRLLYASAIGLRRSFQEWPCWTAVFLTGLFVGSCVPLETFQDVFRMTSMHCLGKSMDRPDTLVSNEMCPDSELELASEDSLGLLLARGRRCCVAESVKPGRFGSFGVRSFTHIFQDRSRVQVMYYFRAEVSGSEERPSLMKGAKLQRWLRRIFLPVQMIG